MRRALTAITLCAALFLTGCTGEDPQTPETPEVTPSATVTAQKTPFTLPYYPNASLHPITSENRTNLVFDVVIPAGFTGTKQLTADLCAAAKEIDPRYECVIHYDIDYYHE